MSKKAVGIILSVIAIVIGIGMIPSVTTAITDANLSGINATIEPYKKWC